MKARVKLSGSSVCRRTATTLCTLFFLSTTAFGQGSTTATIRGTVQDTSGAVLPGVTVTATNVGTNAVVTVVSDDRGLYLLTGLFPGTYTLRAELEGFKSFEQRSLALSPGDNRGIDVRLDVGERTETITVTAQQEVIQTETGAREGVLTARQIDNLSIIGRSSLELLRIMPGVVAPDNTAMESVGFNTGANANEAYTVNGIRGKNAVITLDGSSLVDIGSNNGVIVSMNNDMVQEVRIQSSNYAAEYGSGGVNISGVTKAGTSRFHGTFYDYWRNWRFTANDRSNNLTGVEKPKSNFQYPGGNIGGPIVIPGLEFTQNRDKLFFFGAVEVQRQQVDYGSFRHRVPTAAMRNGDFSELLAGRGQNLNQGTVVNIPGGFEGAGTPAPNNNIAPYIDPIGRALINFFPLPNYEEPENRFNYVLNVFEPVNRVELTSRIDYNISNNTRAYVRVAWNTEDQRRTRGLWWGPSQVELPSRNDENNLGRSVSGNIVSVLSPTMTNEVLVSWSKLQLDNDFEDPSKVSKEALGLPDFGMFPNASPYASTQLLSNWGDTSGAFGNLWSAEPGFIFAHNSSVQFSNKLTKIAGPHALKFGATVEQGNKRQNFQNNEDVLMFFDTWAAGSTGNQIADLLVGRPAQVEQGTKAAIGKFRYYNVDLFAQDAWKVRQNVTFEYGLRASWMPNNTETTGLGAVFDQNFYDPTQGPWLDPGTYARLNGVRYAATGDVDKGLIPNRGIFWLPRANVAWNIDGESNWVLRGGAGAFVNRAEGNREYDVIRVPPNAHYSVLNSFNAPLGYVTYQSLPQVNPFTNLSSVNINGLVSPFSIYYPSTYSYSASLAKRIFFNQVLEVGYVGSRQEHLDMVRNYNFLPAGTLSSGTIGNADLSNPVHRAALQESVVNSFRPFQAYGNVTLVEYEGQARYNSMQATLSRQTGRAFQYLLTYTLSRSRGHIGGEVNPIDPTRSYGVMPSDRTHVLNASYNVFLPDFAQDGNPIAKGLLNGWQLSGISTYSSGIPIRLSFTGDLATAGTAWYGTPNFGIGTGVGAITPMFLGDPRISEGTDVGDRILDVNQIGIPAFGETGPFTPPHNLRTPGRMNHDVTLFKNFGLGGDRRLQFRLGMFNIFNSAYPSNVGAGDLDLTLSTTCNVRVPAGVPRGDGSVTTDAMCDPTGGYSLTPQTLQNFGKINLKRGRRVIEFALKYYF